MSNNGFTTRKRHTRTAWILVAGFWLQPLLTYLATPWLAEDARGHVVFICTLNGLKAVQVEHNVFDPSNRWRIAIPIA